MNARYGKAVAATAVTAAVIGVGTLLGSSAASAATPSTFTTPGYGMDCTTSESGSFSDGYSGSATCSGGLAGAGLWYARVACTGWGAGTYADPFAHEVPGAGKSTTSTAIPACTFGVNSIQVVERTR